MTSNHNRSRADSSELKDLIFRKIGHQRAVKYFNQLKRLFSCIISKTEFDQRCIQIIGRENIPLHNLLITSIFRNACCASVPPPFKCIRKVGGSQSVKFTNGGYQRNCLQSLHGDAFPPAPRKGRSRVPRRARKFGDHSSPLSPLGKPQNVALATPSQDAQEQPSATELNSLGSPPSIEVVSAEEEVEQVAGSPVAQSRSPVIMAPLGISMNFVGAHRVRTHDNSNYGPWICQRREELPDTRSLTSHLEQKLETEGISVPVECGNLLNNALDVYLKGLLEPCFNLGELRYEDEWKLHGLRGMFHGGHNRRANRSTCASMLDFRTAMELSPQIIVNYWSTWLEKIRFRPSD